MILEAHISWQKGLLSAPELSEITSAISAIFGEIDIDDQDLPEILELLKHDKKNEYGKVLFALLDGIGKIKINAEVENDLILKAFSSYKS